MKIPAYLFRTRSIISMLFIIILVSSVWLVFPRTGDFLIIVRPEAISEDNLHVKTVRNGKLLADQRAIIAAKIGSIFNSRSRVTILNEPIGPTSIEDLIEISHSIIFKNDYVEFSFVANITSIISAWIGRITEKSTSRLLIEDWREDAAPLYAISFRLYGGDGRVLHDPTMSEPQLHAAISDFFVETIYRDINNCDVSICVADIQPNRVTIERYRSILKAFPLLHDGGICTGLQSEKACIGRIRDELSIMAQEKRSSATDFLRFLTEMLSLRSQFRGEVRSSDLTNSLDAAIQSISSARQNSPFFDELFDDPVRFSEFLEENRLSEIGLTTGFIKDYVHFANGRSAMRQARYADALSEFDSVIPSSPDWFQPYVEYFRATAALRSAVLSADSLTEIMDVHQDGSPEIISDTIHQSFSLSNIAYFATQFEGEVSEEERRKALDISYRIYVLLNPRLSGTDRTSVSLLYQRVRYGLGDETTSAEALSEGNKIVRSLPNRSPDPYKEFDIRTSLMTGVAWYSSTLQIGMGRRLAERAVRADPNNFLAILNNPEYSGLKGTSVDAYGDWIDKLRDIRKEGTQ